MSWKLAAAECLYLPAVGDGSAQLINGYEEMIVGIWDCPWVDVIAMD
jgi:hypothetical protein